MDLVKSIPFFLNPFFEQDPYSNEYVRAKIGIDTGENEPLKVCRSFRRAVGYLEIWTLSENHIRIQKKLKYEMRAQHLV